MSVDETLLCHIEEELDECRESERLAKLQLEQLKDEQSVRNIELMVRGGLYAPLTVTALQHNIEEASDIARAVESREESYEDAQDELLHAHDCEPYIKSSSSDLAEKLEREIATLTSEVQCMQEEATLAESELQQETAANVQLKRELNQKQFECEKALRTIKVVSARYWIAQSEAKDLRTQLQQAAEDSLETASIMEAQERLLQSLQGIVHRITARQEQPQPAQPCSHKI
eukprot:scaffold1824_cov332-Prasinococcus_capsulatus_cf.AAC.9